MSSHAVESLRHGLQPLVGRSPDESHRAATTLELLYDLTLVVTFGVAGGQLAHALAANHIVPGIVAFLFCMFAAIWAWINNTWFATAYDTDDWMVRLSTLIQMIGVLIIALGVPTFFAGLEDGWRVANQLIVVGYVVMRVPLIGMWLRVARDDKQRSQAAKIRAGMIAIAQVGWIATAIFVTSLPMVVAMFAVCYAIEFAAPVVADRKAKLPFHVHHLTERYGLLAIISLGEGIVGTFAAIQAVVAEQGWSADAIVVLFSGVTLTFGLWWFYFLAPLPQMLTANRDKVIQFAYAHIFVYATIAAVGAGLHAAAYYVEGESELGVLGTLLTVIVPTAAFIAMVYLAWPFMVNRFVIDPLHVVLVGITAVVLGVAIIMAVSGVSLAWCLGVTTLAPWVSVVGFELVGHRHVEQQVANLRDK